MASVKLCAVLKEIMVQRLAYLKKQVGVYPRSHKQFVKVLTRTVHLQRQPSDAPPLAQQFGLDKLPDVKLAFLVMVMSAHVARLSEPRPASNKKGVSCLSLIPIEGVWNSPSVNKLKQFTPVA